LEKDCFWARISEEKLAKDDIFKGLMANFSTKVIGWYDVWLYCSSKFVVYDTLVSLTEMDWRYIVGSAVGTVADGKEER